MRRATPWIVFAASAAAGAFRPVPRALPPALHSLVASRAIAEAAGPDRDVRPEAAGPDRNVRRYGGLAAVSALSYVGYLACSQVLDATLVGAFGVTRSGSADAFGPFVTLLGLSAPLPYPSLSPQDIGLSLYPFATL